jgi:hypothetical protein
VPRKSKSLSQRLKSQRIRTSVRGRCNAENEVEQKRDENIQAHCKWKVQTSSRVSESHSLVEDAEEKASSSESRSRLEFRSKTRRAHDVEVE